MGVRSHRFLHRTTRLVTSVLNQPILEKGQVLPKKKSVRLCAQQFSRDAEKLLNFCSDSEQCLSDAQVSLVYEGAVINLYAAFERMTIGALTGAINNNTSHLSTTTGVEFPKHLTDEVCEYVIIGNGYFNFRGRDGLIGEIKKYVPDDHYLAKTVKEQAYKVALDQLCALRNYAAHHSGVSKKHALKAVDQTKMSSAGSWLKRQNRFQELVTSLLKLSKEIEEKAPY